MQRVRAGHLPIHGGPTDEVSAVLHHDPVPGQDVVEGNRDTARVHPAIGCRSVAQRPSGERSHAPGGGSPPTPSGGMIGKQPGQRFRCCAGIALQEAVHPWVGGALGGVDLENVGGFANERSEAHRELGQPGPDHQHDVGFRHDLRGPLGAEPPGDAQIRILRGQETAGEDRAAGEGTEFVRHHLQFFPRAGEVGSASRQDEGPFCCRQQRSSDGQLMGAGKCRRFERGEGKCLFLRCRGGGDVVGDGEDDGGAVLQGMGNGPPGDIGGILSGHSEGGGADRGGDGGLIDVPRAPSGSWRVTGDQEHGNLRLDRFGKPRDGVAESGSVGGGGCRQFPGDPVVGVSGRDGPALMADRRELHADGLSRVEEVRIAVAHDAEDVGCVLGEDLGDAEGCGKRGHGNSWRYKWSGCHMCLRSASDIALFEGTGGVHLTP